VSGKPSICCWKKLGTSLDRKVGEVHRLALYIRRAKREERERRKTNMNKKIILDEFLEANN